MKPNPICFTKQKLFKHEWEKDLILKEFLFGNIQIEFKSQGLLYKVLCTELGTPHKTQSYLHYQTKIIIWEWGREKER